MESKKCPKCSSNNIDVLAEGVFKCSDCGAVFTCTKQAIPADLSYLQEESSISVFDKSRITAAILAILGGAFGLHKFYIGNYKMGKVYIFLACIGFLSFFIGVIEGIIYLCVSDEEFARRCHINNF